MEIDPTRMCELLVGLADVEVLGVGDPAPGALVVVVERREDRPSCGRCGTTAWVKDRREVDLVDLPAFDQTVTWRVIRTRWRCPQVRCGIGSWTLGHTDIAPAGHRLTTRAARWACEQVGRRGRAVVDVADAPGCDWHTVNDAVIAYGEALLDTDADRIGTVRGHVRHDVAPRGPGRGTLELGGSRFRRRSEEGLRNAAERLRLARVVFATEAQVRTGMGGSIHQVAPSRPLAVDHDEAPVIVVVGTPQWSWELLESLREPIADLLRQPDLAATIGYALVQLQRELDGPVSPSIDEVALTSSLLAQLLGVPEHDVDQVRQTLRSSLVSVLDRLYPALCVLVGDEEAAVFDPEASGLDDRDAILSALRAFGDQLATSTDLAVGDLLAAAEDAIPLHEFVDRVGLDFAAVNAVLARLAERGMPYTPMHNVDGHLRTFEAFITEHREAISARLREGSLNEFRAGGDLSGYLVARRIELAPDPVWLDQWWQPSDAVMLDRVRAWLVEQGADPDLERPSALGPLLDVRQQNSQLVLEVATRAAPILVAWVAKHGEGASVPPPWTAKEPAYEVDRDATAAGIKDFDLLDEARVLLWLAATGRWPDTMPTTLDLQALGLTAEEVDVAGREPEPEPYRPPELEFGDGETVVAGEAGFSDLMHLVESQLTSDLLATSDAYAPLTEPPEKPKRPGGGGSVTAGRNNVPDELKGSIGLIGEVCALRWLAHRYRLDGDEHWVSGYRNLVLDDDGGNDALGYDFVVERSGDQRPYYFEVKTSTGPATAFEFPDVEVRAAQEHWRKDEYRIILITNALDPDARRLQVLPNPFSKEGSPYYRVMGRGIKYGFRIAE